MTNEPTSHAPYTNKSNVLDPTTLAQRTSAANPSRSTCDNFATRISLGNLSQDAALKMWADSDR